MLTKTRIVRIGHSRGIRIPKTLLDEADLLKKSNSTRTWPVGRPGRSRT